MRVWLALLASAPLGAQTRVVVPVEAAAAVPGGAAAAASAPRVTPPSLSAPGVLPPLSMPVSPAAVQSQVAAAPLPAARAPVPASAPAAAPVPAAALAAPTESGRLPPAAARPEPLREVDPFAASPSDAPSPLAAFFASQRGAAGEGAPAGEAAAQATAGGRVFDGAAARPTPDLVPTAVIPQLEYSELGSLGVEWIDAAERREEYRNLRFVLTSDPARVRALRQFLRTEPVGMNSVLRPMFLALRSVTESPKLSGDARMRAVAGLLYRYYNVLRPLVDDSTMPEAVRARAGDVILNFLSEWRVATELLRGGEVRRALDRLEAVEAEGRALESGRAAPAAGPRPAGAAAPVADIERGWEVLPGRQERVTADEVRQSLVSLDGLKSRVEKVTFFMERMLARHRLAAERQMSPAFVEARRLEALEYLRETVTPVRRMTRSSLPRYTEMTLGRTWMGDDQSKRPSHIWVPDHPGLTMRAVPGGVLVRADFETTISDARTLEAFKRSVERHWSGPFELDGRPLDFRVEVSIRSIPPTAPFSPDALRLKESDFAFALPDTVALSKAWDFDVAAHEFGHILGLPDEYIEFYAPRRRVGVTRYNPGSIMSGHVTGVVHPRHRRAAYGLLAVHSVVSPDVP